MSTATTKSSVDERLDGLADQLAEIRGELRRQREDRERWQELADDLAPIAEEAVSMATRHLDADHCDFGQVASLAHALVRDAATLEAWIGPLRILSALADELGPLATPATASLNARLQQLDERGYFSFARDAAGVVDTVVTSFNDEDVKLLGDNIVLILRTVKQMTQPEVMSLLGRTAVTLQEVESGDTAKTPSTFALLRQMRDPEVRRGLVRVLATLRTIGAEHGPATTVHTGGT
jgi:uncharacterized protein YjgD (DUF1641 family)